MRLPLRMMSLRLSVGSLAFCSMCLGAPLDDALETIRKANRVDDEAVGYSGERTKTYDAYETLLRNASKERLLSYASDPNANVKAYAAMALRHSFPKENFHPLLMEKLKDRQSFEFMSGCGTETLTIADMFHRMLADKLSKEQREEVIGYLLVNGQDLTVTHEGLPEWEIPERHLPTLRTMARQENGSALLALAKFRKTEDYPLIIESAKEMPEASYQAIAMNPQPVYFNLLKETLPAMVTTTGYDSETDLYYAAIAAFRSKEAASLLDQALDSTAKGTNAINHFALVGNAIAPIADPVFDALKWRLWSQQDVLDLQSFSRMKALDEEQANKLTRQTLGRITYRIPDDLLNAMLADMMLKDPEFTQEVIAGELRKADVSRYEFFAKLAREGRKEVYIEPLLTAVESADNAHIYLPATEAILSYGKEELNQRLIAAPKKNPALNKDWGGEAFQKRMKEIQAGK